MTAIGTARDPHRFDTKILLRSGIKFKKSVLPAAAPPWGAENQWKRHWGLPYAGMSADQVQAV
jgi:hypothetical protein